MVDTHMHIIHGMDDGAKTIEVAINMLRMAEKHGTSQIIATPHYKHGSYENKHIDVLFHELTTKARRKGIGVKLHLGNELYLNEENVIRLLDGDCKSMADTSYVLVELPFHHYYPFHEQLLHQLQMKGYKVILAHVERYYAFRKDSSKLESLIRKGFYGQMTASYIVERKSRKKAFQLIEAGYIQLVASDAHNDGSRNPILSEAYRVIKSRYGAVVANNLFKDNGRRIIGNQPLIIVKANRMDLLNKMKIVLKND